MKLEIQEVTKRYGSKTAVDHLSLCLTSGVYGLLGANGAGKTTLMRLICGVQPPTAGRIALDGKEIVRLGAGYRSLLGYLPQQFDGYPEFTAMELLRYVAALKGLSPGQGNRRAGELLGEVGLAKESRRKIKTFSGGMKRRLGIAQAMLNNPQVLILDEPTAGLDPKERIRFRNLISACANGRIVLLSTHIVSDVEAIAQQIMLMKGGKILRAGRADQIAAELDGAVWECVVPTDQAEQLAQHMLVSNLRNLDQGRVALRVIAGQPPLPCAVPVRPDLEDFYLSQFGGGAGQ